MNTRSDQVAFSQFISDATEDKITHTAGDTHEAQQEPEDSLLDRTFSRRDIARQRVARDDTLPAQQSPPTLSPTPAFEF